MSLRGVLWGVSIFGLVVVFLGMQIPKASVIEVLGEMNGTYVPVVLLGLSVFIGYILILAEARTGRVILLNQMIAGTVITGAIIISLYMAFYSRVESWVLASIICLGGLVSVLIVGHIVSPRMRGETWWAVTTLLRILRKQVGI